MIRYALLVALLTVGTVPGEEPVLAIVKRSLDLENRNWQRAKDYTYQAREVVRDVDSSGRVKNTRAQAHDILMVYGRPYTRLIEKNGKPLNAADEAKEDNRLRKEMEKRRRQSEDADSKERREYEKSRAEARKYLNEIPQAFDFRLVGEEMVSGKPAWVVQAEPKLGYQAHNSKAQMFTKIHGRLWIDKAEYQWVKIDAETTDTISFGGFLARLARGSTFRFEQQRVNDEVWLPSRGEVAFEARLALLKKLHEVAKITYTNYRKFRTDSRILSTEANQ